MLKDVLFSKEILNCRGVSACSDRVDHWRRSRVPALDPTLVEVHHQVRLSEPEDRQAVRSDLQKVE